MNLQHANLNRLDVARRDLRDLKGLGPLVASSLRSDATGHQMMGAIHLQTQSYSVLYTVGTRTLRKIRILAFCNLTAQSMQI